ncbi:probable xyloglucan galactosyltransferase GT20 [Raphanus sativus]|uniref:Probable xyloglucan galactosyltransferase GT20 n=1 Tax=Raphanus sativus TaxID=3726 RepID=A0A6J0KBK2_RAPSA|nr:probable xyloglucan galactosyltransferase GT20 [Raphanus sativus]
MGVSVSKRKLRSSKKTDDPRIFFLNNLCYVFFRSIVYLTLITVIFFFLICLWLSFTTLISDNVLPICVLSWKLNHPYCLTDGSKRVFQTSTNLTTRSEVFGKDEASGSKENEDGDKAFGDQTKIYGVNVISDSDSKAKNKSKEDQDNYTKPKSEEEVYALREVTKYIHIQRSWISTRRKVENPRSCEGKGVYVYDLPSKFNRDLLVDCIDMVPWTNMCKFFKNDGFGEPIENLGQGWFRTHQYALEPILHSRVLKHPCRVYKESQAKIFYVPFYGGFDVLRWHFKNVSNDVKDRLAIEILEWLGSKESWKRNAGKDHVFVLGKISWDFRRNKFQWGSRFLDLQEMQNPTKLLIERHPWEVNDIAIPHPTYFHPKTDYDITSWQNKMISKPRRNLISFAGGARPGNPNSIRSTLIEQCTLFSDQCRFLNCSDGSCDQPENVIKLFQDSEFCMQPPGDSPTRKSVFDSLISGCIPVIFDPYTAYYQYSWHLPEDHKRYSVYVNQEDVKEKRVNVVEKLMAKTIREREVMRSYIVHHLLPGLVYGDSNAKFDRFRDAFDITFDNLIEKINKLV